LYEIEESLSKFSVDIHGDERTLRRVIKKLNGLANESSKIKNNMDTLTNELDEVKSERVRRFNECLQIVNKEIENFCQHAMSGRVKAELKVLDNREPYLNGVQYSWATEATPHNLVTDLNRNYHAAFALLMGILK
jgi:archaellum component FlaC